MVSRYHETLAATAARPDLPSIYCTHHDKTAVVLDGLKRPPGGTPIQRRRRDTRQDGSMGVQGEGLTGTPLCSAPSAGRTCRESCRTAAAHCTLGALGGRSGTWSSRTRRVIAMAKMPSLSASMRFFPSSNDLLSACMVMPSSLPGMACILPRVARRNVHAYPVRSTGVYRSLHWRPVCRAPLA